MPAASVEVTRCTRAEQLEEEIVELCAHLNAATYRLLQLIVELDDEEPWGAWGLRSCAHWLNWRCGIGLNAAREKVRVAHALQALPQISEGFKTGELSFSKVRAMTRVATVDNEEYLLMIARYGTAAQVEKLVRACRGVKRNEEREKAQCQHEERSLQYFYDEDGTLVIRAKLPPEQGAVVLKALEAAVDALQEEKAAETDVETAKDVTAVTSRPDSGNATFVQRRADALVLMAETTLGSEPRSLSSAQRYQVMVHVSAETLCDDSQGRCEIEDGPALPVDTVRRLACDSSLIALIEDENGTPLNIGRKTRAIPPAMQRALQARDGGCCFPGCTQHKHVDAHHITHWADGGETNLDNLVQLCPHHHRLMHEGGFGLARGDDGTLVFSRPDARVIASNPGLQSIGSLTDLFELNRQAGLSLDAQSCPTPPGDVMDYDLAVYGLLTFDIQDIGFDSERPI
ncbi:MAG: HNH endonuclease [Gammaproteobacteria bacterium]|nr:HNH endonuclease [Gammaproteobacteria bacterium]